MFQIPSLYIAALYKMQMLFINGTPVVEGNRARAELVVNESTANLLCELLTKKKLDSPMVANCECIYWTVIIEESSVLQLSLKKLKALSMHVR